MVKVLFKSKKFIFIVFFSLFALTAWKYQQSSNEYHDVQVLIKKSQLCKYDEVNPDITCLEKGERVLIVMVHGLRDRPSDEKGEIPYKKVEKNIKKTYPNCDINFLYIKFDNTLKTGLKEQGRIITNQLDQYFKNHIEFKNARIIFIGCCTGALAAFEGYKLSKDKHNIAGIISSGAPWQGAYCVKGKNNCNWFFNNTIGRIAKKHSANKYCSIRNIVPGSKYLNSLKESIEKSDIPIWAVGSKTKIFEKIFATKIMKIFFNKNSSEENIFGSYKHDGLVSLKSQCALDCQKVKSISINENCNHTTGNKIDILNVMLKAKKFFGIFCSKADLDKMFYVVKEPSITQTKAYFLLVNRFIEKYGLFPKTKFNEDEEIINGCEAKCLIKETLL